MKCKVTFAKVVTMSKVYDTDEDETASKACYAETQDGALDIAVTVPEGFTVENITDEDTIWHIEKVNAPRKEFRPLADCPF